MQYTQEQKEQGFETWQHIWNVQRLLVACQKSLMFDTPKVDFIGALNKICTFTFSMDASVDYHCAMVYDLLDLPIDADDKHTVLSIFKNTFQQVLSQNQEPLHTSFLALSNRAISHDQSKFSSIEVSLFTEYTPKLKAVEFGSAEYASFLDELKPALVSHYANNRHHPEFYDKDLSKMSLFDCIEMCCDWAASGLRTKNGSFEQSIAHTKKRFMFGEAFEELMVNTFNHCVSPYLHLESKDYMPQKEL